MNERRLVHLIDPHADERVFVGEGGQGLEQVEPVVRYPVASPGTRTPGGSKAGNPVLEGPPQPIADPGLGQAVEAHDIAGGGIVRPCHQAVAE